MGVATPPIFSHHSSKTHLSISTPIPPQQKDITLITCSNSMSQDFSRNGHHHQQALFFPPPPNGFDREADQQAEPQILRDKMQLLQGFEAAAAPHQLVGVEPPLEPSRGLHPAVYDSMGMLSEMFNFGPRPPQHHHQQPTPHMLISQPPFTWIPEGGGGGGGVSDGAAGGMVEVQGLSLSLSSSLEAAKAEELRMGSGGYGGVEMMFFNNQEGRAMSASSNPLQGYSHQPVHFGLGSSSSSVFSLGAVNVLRNSKYTRPAQELLEEFCSVGRGHLKKNKFAAGNNNPTGSTSGGGAGPSSSNSSKDRPPLSPADRMEHQRRKVKLMSLLDEVERRYNHYCEQMQMVVNAFDMVMGFGAAVPYTALAQKAMSRHFRCLKEAIEAQLKHSCELLGEKDVTGSTGISKGETPRLKMLEQSLRKQRAFQQMGMMDQEVWRPQRGLPERSVNILRAWLFEHFLHPYPSTADKHLLARQTGLSRSQVSNWFINARVRLWKPMVEDMYQQEAKELEEGGENEEQPAGRERLSNSAHTSTHLPLPLPLPISAAPTTMTTSATLATGSQFNASAENDPSLFEFNRAITAREINASSSSSENQLISRHPILAPPPAVAPQSTGVGPNTNSQLFISRHVDAWNHFGTTAAGGGADSSTAGPSMITFGTATGAGDVSLTLGLRHSAAAAGSRNPPEKSGYFGS